MASLRLEHPAVHRLEQLPVEEARHALRPQRTDLHQAVVAHLPAEPALADGPVQRAEDECVRTAQHDHPPVHVGALLDRCRTAEECCPEQQSRRGAPAAARGPCLTRRLARRARSADRVSFQKLMFISQDKFSMMRLTCPAVVRRAYGRCDTIDIARLPDAPGLPTTRIRNQSELI